MYTKDNQLIFLFFVCCLGDCIRQQFFKKAFLRLRYVPVAIRFYLLSTQMIYFGRPVALELCTLIFSLASPYLKTTFLFASLCSIVLSFFGKGGKKGKWKNVCTIQFLNSSPISHVAYLFDDENPDTQRGTGESHRDRNVLLLMSHLGASRICLVSFSWVGQHYRASCS